MTKKPFFSIIIPTYNCAEKLGRTLESIFRQSFKDFEVIVCDDGSTDHVKGVVDSFANSLNIQYVWNEHWGGPALPRNNGLNIAKGKYIAFLDSDDWWYPNKLEVVSNYLEGADFLYHDLDIVTKKGKKRFKKIKGRYLKNPVFVDLMINCNPIFPSSVIIRKNIINMAGGFSLKDTLEDFDLWLKVSRLTEKFFYLPKVLGAYLLREEGRNSPSEKMINRLRTTYYTHLGYLNNKNRKESELILSYLLARSKQKIGLLKEALELFKKSAQCKNLRFKIKSLIWIVFIHLKLVCQKN